MIKRHSLVNRVVCVNSNHRGRSYSQCPTDCINSPTASTGTNCCVICMVYLDTVLIIKIQIKKEAINYNEGFFK